MTMGELLAWVIGWDLILEYLFSGAAVAVSWSCAVQDMLAEPAIGDASLGLGLPVALLALVILAVPPVVTNA